MTPFQELIISSHGLPRWLNWERIHPQCGRPGFDPWVGKIPWRREWLPTPAFWPRKFHGLYSPWDCKKSDTTEQLSLSLSYIPKSLVLRASNTPHFRSAWPQLVGPEESVCVCVCICLCVCDRERAARGWVGEVNVNASSLNIHGWLVPGLLWIPKSKDAQVP